jgi:hypothetical protein
MILLDTNLPTRLTDSSYPQCPAARRAIHALLGKREQLVVIASDGTLAGIIRPSGT